MIRCMGHKSPKLCNGCPLLMRDTDDEERVTRWIKEDHDRHEMTCNHYDKAVRKS